MSGPAPRSVTQRRDLAQSVRHLLDDYRRSPSMRWRDGDREGDLRLALAGILRLMELEGMSDFEAAKARAEARRCPSCGQDPRYTPPDFHCVHEALAATGGGLPETPGIQ